MKKLTQEAAELDVVLRAKANHEKFTKEESDWLRQSGAILGEMGQEINKLEREIAELRKDKERLDYLLSDYGAGTRDDIDEAMKGGLII